MKTITLGLIFKNQDTIKRLAKISEIYVRFENDMYLLTKEGLEKLDAPIRN
jgi:hypothetical protein